MLVALTTGRLVLLEVAGTALVVKGDTKLPYEVSCLTVNPLASDATTTSALVAAVGLWTDNSVRLVALVRTGSVFRVCACSMCTTCVVYVQGRGGARDCILAVFLVSQASAVRCLLQPSLTELTSYRLKGDAQSRSVVLSTLDGTHYLFIALGDGHVVSLELTTSVAQSGDASLQCTLVSPKKVCCPLCPVRYRVGP